MMRTASQRLQTYFGWCPNSPGVHAQTRDLAKGRGAPGSADLDPPQPQTMPARIVTPAWMNAIALLILFATFFVGGNPWWVALVFVVLVILVTIHIRTIQKTQGA